MNIIGGMRDSHAVASEGKRWKKMLKGEAEEMVNGFDELALDFSRVQDL